MMSSELIEFFTAHSTCTVVTGAGISAPSGIPTYRDQAGNWQRSTPIQHQEFLSQHAKRQRYWARSAIGWNYLEEAKPNEAHQALKVLEERGKIPLLITQNVDRLHQKAGHKSVIDLHGRIDQAVCLNCGQIETRESIQERLEKRHPELANIHGEVAPDGDAHVEDWITELIEPPNCLKCSGILMPDVVFFGGTVPRSRVDQGLESIKATQSLLVIGSSLKVYSGFRFCRFAHENNIPIAILNKGITRADDIATLKIDQACGPVLKNLIANI